jgi:hypothetical protein
MCSGRTLVTALEEKLFSGRLLFSTYCRRSKVCGLDARLCRVFFCRVAVEVQLYVN